MQPTDNQLDERAARCLLEAQVRAIRPTAIIAATQAQARAFAPVARGAAVHYLPHHSWAGLEPAPARATVTTIGYEGNALYLAEWEPVLRRLCAARGWAFVVNPSDLRALDLFVALRGGPWDGYMPREWKSGVKVVNALAAGRPLLTQSTAAFSEIGAPGEVVETRAQLEAALDAWTPYARRAAAVEACRTLAPAYTLAAVAETYRGILIGAREQTCAT